ncbi:terminal uridylyltransferase 7-like isoform X1 [Lytechinus pictus]|uniref:terminal uridylyltransferase 7-like isoform X1 n=1 Tax=Lytechinus pictus TaxID=7653 RepID=UPI0030B9EBD3
MEKKDTGNHTCTSKGAVSPTKQSYPSSGSPHTPQSKGKGAKKSDVSKERPRVQSRPMDKQRAPDTTSNQTRNYQKKERERENHLKAPKGIVSPNSSQQGFDSLQVTVNGDKQGRSVQKQSAKKMERNYAKKMERGMVMKNSNGNSAEEAKQGKPDPNIVQILQREGKVVQEQAGNTTPTKPGKGSGKKRTIDRKPLGKLVNAKLREGEEGSKATSGQTSPKKSGQQPPKEQERQPGWKVQKSNPAADQELRGGNDSAEPWKDSMEKQELELEKTYIFRLAKRSLKFPRALYYCRLCNYHIDTLPQCWLHIDQSRHNRLAKAKESENFFKNLPLPSKSHARALTTLLEDVTEEHALTGRELNQRNEVRQRVENALQSNLPECKVRIYGSSLSSFGFHDSDINLDVDFPNEKQASKILLAVSQGIASRVDKHFTEFEADFEGKHPCVRFKDIESGYRCELGTGNQNAIQSSQLMVEYNECDGRLRPLVMGLRYWARMCGIDQQSIGAMPAHTFVLLVIYFLQQCEPQVLPVLQQKNDHFKTQNKKTVGELWIDLLRYYLVGVNIEEIVISIRQREPVLRADLKLPNRRIAIEDPFANGKKNVAKSLTTASVFQYIMDRFHDALKYFGIPQNGLSTKRNSPGQPSVDSSVNDSPRERDSDASNCNENEGHSRGDRVPAGIRLDSSEDLGMDGDDCDTAAGIGAKLAEMVLNEVESEESEAVGTSDEDNQNTRRSGTCSPERLSRTDETRTLNTSQESVSSGEGNRANSLPPEKTLPSYQDTNGAAELDNSVTSAFINQLDNSSRNMDNALAGDDMSDSRSGQSKGESDEEFVFTFDKEILTRGETVQLICTSCLKEGHVSKDCPDDTLPPLKPLPPMDPKFLECISRVCEEILLRHQPSHLDLRGRDKCIRELEYYIRQHALRDAQLSLFGSSGNGFGFRNSDLDICLTFQDVDTGQHVDVGFVIERLAAALKRNHNLYNIVPIPTAKVPIVKFVHRPTRLEGDISLYNTLAQCNTRLLFMYSQIDPRVRALGYSMKLLAKFCDIGDASRGSLSSYAYTLLTIYFLQQRKPPVLPVLQELYSGEKQPVHEVDGWNAWFFDNLNQLQRVWKGSYKNTESIGSLWLGMLCFYTEEFDFTKYVVSIRQHKPLTRFEKLWMTPQRGMAIEDPFDLEHNLGGAASKKMAIYIIQVLRNARDLFGTPRRIPREHIMDYFLNLEALSGGEPPPNDRGCRICGKIGHFVKDCPIKKRGMERKEQEKRDRERRDRPSPNDTGTPIKGTPKERSTESPNVREERKRPSESKPMSGSTPSKAETPTANNNSSVKDNPSSSTKEERESSKPTKPTERSVEDVARQLYPVKPIPVKKSEDTALLTKEPKQTEPSISVKPEKPSGSEKESKGSVESNPSTTPGNPPDNAPGINHPRTRKEKPTGHNKKKGAGEGSKEGERREARLPGGVGNHGGKTHEHSEHESDQNGHGSKVDPSKKQEPNPLPEAEHGHGMTNASTHQQIPESIGIPGSDRENPNGPGPNPLPPPQFPLGAGPPPPMGFHNLPIQALMGFNMPPEDLLRSMIDQHHQQQQNLLQQHQQQQQQEKLAALFQVMGKQSPLHAQAPTQSPSIRPPTTPASAQTLDEIEQKLKSKQQQQHQQQTPPRLPPGAKLEQQFRQDQFFHNKNMSPGIRPQHQQHIKQETPPQHPQQQGHRQQLSPQQMFSQQPPHGYLPPSQKVIARPPGLGNINKNQEQDQDKDHPQQRSANQSQPIPIDSRQGQQQQQWQPLRHPGWGSPSAFSPPSPYNPIASPPSHQQSGFPHQMQQHPAASPPHNLLQSPPGASTPPAMAQYFGHSPFGPSVLPAGFLESRQSPIMAVSPPHHPQQQQQHQAPISGWPQQPASAMAWQKQPDLQQVRQQQHHQQFGEPQMASAGSPRSPVESDGSMASNIMPLEAQLEVQQAFGQSHSNRQDIAQSFHYSPLGLNPSLPRSTHTIQPSQHHVDNQPLAPQHGQQHSQQHLPHARHHPQYAPQHAQQHLLHAPPLPQHSDPGWQQQQQQQQRSNVQISTTTAVGGPIMSVGQGDQPGESVLLSSRFPHQTTR